MNNTFVIKCLFGMDYGEHAKVDRCTSPQQKNGFDCGLFVLGIAKHLTGNNNCISLVDGKTSYDSKKLDDYFQENGGHESFASDLRSSMLEYVLKHVEQGAGHLNTESSPLDQNNQQGTSPSSPSVPCPSVPCPYPSTKLFIPSLIVPCLLLHNGPDIFPGLTNLHACDLNARTLILTRFGVNCEDVLHPGNIVHTLRNEKVGQSSCMIGGRVIVVFTSYTADENHMGDSMPMISISERSHIPSIYNALPLTKVVVKKAMTWLNGNSYDKEKQDTGDEDDSIEVVLTKYFKLLKEKIPLQQPINTISPKATMTSVLEFIGDHDWDSEDEAAGLTAAIEEELPDLDEEVIDEFVDMDPDYEELIYKTRRFLHRNVAKQTGVVAHIVDGLHRCIGLESTLNGSGEDEGEYSQYNYLSPHSSLEFSATMFIPTVAEFKSKDAFKKTMKAISINAQAEVGCVQALGKKPFIVLMINLLDRNFQDDVVHYNYFMNTNINNFGLDESLGIVVDQIRTTIISEEATTFHGLVPSMNLESLKELNQNEFMRIFVNQGEDILNWCFLCNTNKFTATYLISRYCTMYHESRYTSTSIINAEAFELLMILFWSRLSSTTYEQLMNFFQSDNCASRQVSTADPFGRLTNKWLTCMIITVFTSVHYSSKAIWIKMTAKDRKNKKKSNTALKPLLYMHQLMHAIEICTQLYSEIGFNPVHPDWFESVLTSHLTNHKNVLLEYDKLIKRKGFDSGDLGVAIKKDLIVSKLNSNDFAVSDFVSFITLGFAVSLFDINKNEDDVISDDIAQDKIIGLDDTQSLYTARINEFVKNVIVNDIKNAEDECVHVMRHILGTKFFMPSKPETKDKPTKISHQTPSMEVYAKIAKLSTEFKTISATLNTLKKVETSHTVECKINQLLGLIEKVQPSLFSPPYVNGED